MKTAIVWFKTDLRLEDNETLINAIEHNDQVIPVYCFDDIHYRTTQYGFRKTGSFRTQFILQALEDLDRNLRGIGSGLMVVRGDTPEELMKLVIKYKATRIYAKEEVAYEELNMQKEVQEKIMALDCTLEVFNTSSLYQSADLPFATQDIPNTFTTFRQKVESLARVRTAFAKPNFIQSPTIPVLQLPALTDLNLHAIKADNRAAFNFNGGESYALDRLHYYFDRSKLVSSYKTTRNQSIGPDYSTKYSPWLAIGCLSPVYIYYSLKRYEEHFGANDSTNWVIFELLWRDYFRLMMKKYGCKFFLKSGIKVKAVKENIHSNEKLQLWKNGKTGIDFIDANMQELKLTGFMSNRGRQNVASYYCHDLKLDWRYGAAYFEEQLIDYDVCSNWGNWAYIAGVGNDPRPDRYFNIKKQADQYDADGTYRALWNNEATM